MMADSSHLCKCLIRVACHTHRHTLRQSTDTDTQTQSLEFCLIYLRESNINEIDIIISLKLQ